MEEEKKERKSTSENSFFDEDNDLFSSGSSTDYSSSKNFIDGKKAKFSEIKSALKEEWEVNKIGYEEEKEASKHEKPSKVFDTVLLILMLVFFFVGFFFGGLGNNETVGILGALGFIVCCLTLVIKVVIRQKIHLKPPTKDCIKHTAKVVTCTQSSRTTVGNRPTVIVYKVVVEIDGKNYTSFSYRHFKKNSTVTVYTKKDPKKYCHICDEDEYYDFD